jgi:hypothetical protein
MNPAHLVVLSFSMFGIVSSALAQDAQDVRAQVWIHEMVDLHDHAYAKQYLFDAGYQADRAHDYDAAFYNLSSFSKVNYDRLQAATSDDEKAFRDWLKSRLKDLDRICNRKSPQNGSVSKRPSFPATSQKYSQTPANGDSTQEPSGPANQASTQRPTDGDSTQEPSGPINQASTQRPTDGDSTKEPSGPTNQASTQRPTDGDSTQEPSGPGNQASTQRPTDGDSTKGPGVDPANWGNSRAPTDDLNPQEPSGSPSAPGISRYVTNGVKMGGMSSQSEVGSTPMSVEEGHFPNGDFGNLWSRFNSPSHLWIDSNNPAANDANRKSGAQNAPVQINPSHASVHTSQSASVHTIQSHASVHITQSASVHTIQSHASAHTSQSASVHIAQSHASVHTAQSQAPIHTTQSASIHTTQSHNPIHITPPHRSPPRKQ